VNAGSSIAKLHRQPYFLGTAYVFMNLRHQEAKLKYCNSPAGIKV
jgi:hypothetical protein